MSMIEDDNTHEACFYCGQPVDLNSAETLAWVIVGRHASAAHKTCDDRNAEENGPNDNILDPHGVGEVGWAENH